MDNVQNDLNTRRRVKTRRRLIEKDRTNYTTAYEEFSISNANEKQELGGGDECLGIVPWCAG